MSGSDGPEPVYLEVGAKRVFASALNWPGWCRSGKDEPLALAALEGIGPRYAAVAGLAGLDPRPRSARTFDILERVPGSGTTDFGAPGAVASRDLEPVGEEEARRLAALVNACWEFFDRVVAGAPAELRKGPRGGGRDRDKVVSHVAGAEAIYARRIGLRLPAADLADPAATGARRRLISSALAAPWDGPPAEPGWPPRYAARRIAWHVLDHAWEIQDRSPPPEDQARFAPLRLRGGEPRQAGGPPRSSWP